MSSDTPLTLEVPVDLVDEDPQNARQTFAPEQLQVLADSLKEQQLSAIIVRKVGDRYLLVDGARRLRAAKAAGLKTLRADIYAGLDEKSAAVAAATANLQREDLTPYEEARAYHRLLEEPIKWTKKEICAHFGIPFNTLQARLELLELPEALAQRVGDARSGAAFGLGHAKAVLAIANHPQLLSVALKVLEPEEDGSIMAATNCGYHIGRALQNAGLVRAADYDAVQAAGLDDINQLTKALGDLEVVQVGLEGYGLNKFYVDPKAFDKKVAELGKAAAARRAELKTKAAKAAKKTKPAAKADHARVQKQQVDRVEAAFIETMAVARWQDAVAKHLAHKGHLAEAAWCVLTEGLSSDRYSVPEQTTWSAVFRTAAQAVGVKPELAGKVGGDADRFVDITGSAPKWFLQLAPAKQLAFVTTVLAASQYHGNEDASIILTGKPYATFEKDAKAANLKSGGKAHEESPKKGGDAKGKPASPKKAAPAPSKAKPAKAKGKAAPKAKKVAKGKQATLLTPAVAKAREKLKAQKGAQAKLVVAPAGASPREIADRVLAKPLQGLHAVQTAAKAASIPTTPGIGPAQA